MLLGVLLAPVFFLTMRSWSNAILFILVLLALKPIFTNYRDYFIGCGARFWLMLGCFLTPFASEFIAQMGRGELLLSSLDGPSRMLIAGIIFVYFSRLEPHLDFARAITVGSFFGIMSVALSLMLFPETYWHLRAATYFVDPITLPCFSVGLCGIVLLGKYKDGETGLVLTAKVVALIATVWIALESQSRSSWVALLSLCVLYSWIRFRHSRIRQVFAIILLVLSASAIYIFSDVFRYRVDEAIGGIINYVSTGQGQTASSGQRLAMIDVDLVLLSDHFWFGIRDGEMPPYESLLEEIPTLTEEVYSIKTLAGSHSEFFAQLVRRGGILGGLSLLAMFFVPMWIFLCRSSSTEQLISKKAGEIGLGFLVPLFVSGFAIQVFNLKMTTSFHSLVLAIFLGTICSQSRLATDESNLYRR
jgi:hypothetical protein